MFPLLILLSTLRLAYSSFEELDNFYVKLGNVKTVGEIQNGDVCRMRYARANSILGRNSPQQDPHADKNGQSGSGILLVHVGKAAGGTVAKLLQNANKPFSHLHVHTLDRQMIEEYVVIILCLRDPLQRTVSAFNWRDPHQRKIAKSWTTCGTRKHDRFYKCFKNIDDYAEKLAEISKCGTIAREGECHLEMDTCAYLGGVVDILIKNRRKVFIVDTATIMRDMNALSSHLQWNTTFGALPHEHSNEVSADKISLSMLSAMKLSGYLEISGEAPLYRQLISLFKLP